jgi:glycosyltransferase involved in cell wall biosynthesis
MSEYPLVSICIPAFNSSKWIKSTIQSAISQTWPNKEIIIVDDGSTDNTLDLVREFRSDLINIITQKNRGASAARNRALFSAKGDFIQWLDADDILAPDKIEIQLRNSDKKPTSKVLHSSSWGCFYHRLRSARFVQTPLWQDLSPIQYLSYHLGEADFLPPLCWLVSRSIAESAGDWDERLSYNDDGEYFCRVICASDLIRFHRDARGFYRTGNLSSLSRSLHYSEKAWRSYSLSINLCVEHSLKLENSDEIRRACISALNMVISYKNLGDLEIIKENEKRIIELGGQNRLPKMSFIHQIVAKIIGIRRANSLKAQMWLLQIVIARYWDKLLSLVYGDEI